MKQLKLILSVACAVAIVAPAFATKLSVSGGGTIRYGYTSSKDTAGESTKKMGFSREDDAMKINFNVASDDDALTACYQYRVYSGGPSQGEGWIQYNFGTVQVKYNANGIQGAWDNDILYLHDGVAKGISTVDGTGAVIAATQNGLNAPMSLNVNIKAAEGVDVFATAIQQSTGQQNTKNRSMPIVQFGATVAAGPATVTAGLVFDSHKGQYNDNGDPTITVTETSKKSGMLFFAKASVKATDMITAFINGAYGKNYGGFGAEGKDDSGAIGAATAAVATTAKGDATLIGLRAGVDAKVTDADTVSAQVKYSQFKQTDKLTGYFFEVTAKHALNANFAVKGGFNYGSAKWDTTGAKAASSTGIFGQAEFTF